MLRGDAVALGPDRVYVAERSGTVSALSDDGGERCRFEHTRANSYAVKVRANARWVVTHDGMSVEVRSLEGALAVRWVCPRKGLSVLAAEPTDEGALVCVSDYHEPRGWVLHLRG